MSSFRIQELAIEPNYKKISLSNRERILEGMLRRTEEELKTKEQMIKSKDDRDSRAKEKAVAAIKELENIIYILSLSFARQIIFPPQYMRS